MKKLMKYALIAGTGYAIHSALNRTDKIKSEMYVGPMGPSLRTKLVNTVSDHIGSKTHDYLFGKPTPPPNAGSRYMRYGYREAK